MYGHTCHISTPSTLAGSISFDDDRRSRIPDESLVARSRDDHYFQACSTPRATPIFRLDSIPNIDTEHLAGSHFTRTGIPAAALHTDTARRKPTPGISRRVMSLYFVSQPVTAQDGRERWHDFRALLAFFFATHFSLSISIVAATELYVRSRFYHDF